MSLNESKVEECIIDVIRSYNDRKRITKFVNVSHVAETDGAFFQTVIRTLTDDIWFTDPSHVPLYGRLGAAIAEGEERGFIKKILDEIDDVEETDLSDFIPDLLTEKLSGLSAQDTLILTPIKIKYDHMLKKRNIWAIDYDYEFESFVLKLNALKVPVYSIHEDLIDSHVICLNKNFGEWIYKTYPNPYDSSKDETIFVEIKRAAQPFKVEILIRSLSTFRIVDPSQTKILDIT